MPSPQQYRLPFLHNPLNAPHLGPPKPTALLQPDRVQPELCHSLLSLNVNVLRLISVPGIEE